MPLALLLATGCLSTTGIVYDLDDGRITDLDDAEAGDDGHTVPGRSPGLSGPAGWFVDSGDTGDLAGPTPTGILLAWTEGTDRDDRPTALAPRSDGGLLVGGYFGASPDEDHDQRAELIALQPDGTPAWRTTLVSAAASLVIDTVLPTDDDGAWACASARTATTLSPEPGEVPETWSSNLAMVHVDAWGSIDAAASLGVTSGGELAAGCSLGPDGDLVVDGSVNDGVLQLVTEGRTVTLTDFGAHGFVTTFTPDGRTGTTATWRTGPHRRQAGVVRPDGSIVQILRYAGDPGLAAGGSVLTPCPGTEVCTGLLVIDADGRPAWTAAMGAGLGEDPRLASTADGGLLLATDLGESGLLPQADGDPIADAVGGEVLVAWTPELVLDWLVHLSDRAEVTALRDYRDGGAIVGLWTGDAASLQVGDATIVVAAQASGTLGLATIDAGGHTSWLWTAQGQAEAWPTAVRATETGIGVATVFRGSLSLSLGSDAVTFDSLVNDVGQPTNDLAVFLLAPEPGDAAPGDAAP